MGPLSWLAKNCDPPSADQHAVFPAGGNSSSTRWCLGFRQPSIIVNFCAALRKNWRMLLSASQVADSFTSQKLHFRVACNSSKLRAGKR